MKIQNVDNILDALIVFFSKLNKQLESKETVKLEFDNIRQLQLTRIFVSGFLHEEEYNLPTNVFINFNEARLNATVKLDAPKQKSKQKEASTSQLPYITEGIKIPKKLKNKQAVYKKTLLNFKTKESYKLYKKLMKLDKKILFNLPESITPKECLPFVRGEKKTSCHEFCLRILSNQTSAKDCALFAGYISSLKSLKDSMVIGEIPNEVVTEARLLFKNELALLTVKNIHKFFTSYITSHNIDLPKPKNFPLKDTALSNLMLNFDLASIEQLRVQLDQFKQTLIAV
jgi:hypothetical protein